MPRGVTGDSASPTNGVSRSRLHSRFSMSDSRPGSMAAGRTNRSDFQRRSASAGRIRRARVRTRLSSRLCRSVGDSSVSSTVRAPSGNRDQTRSMIAESCRVAIDATLVCHPRVILLVGLPARRSSHPERIPEFWEGFIAETVKQSCCVGRAGIPRPPGHCSPGRVWARRR